MENLRDQAKSIIEELIRVQTFPAPYLDEKDDLPFPRMMDTGNQGAIIVSRELDEAIATFADNLLSIDPTLSPKVTIAEWRKSVRKAFGPVLAMIDLDVEPAKHADTVVAEVKLALGKQVSGYGIREFAFGCSLFANGAIKPFSIGPVCFEHRSDWLARKNQDGSVTTITRRRVEQVWSGKRPSKRKPTADSIRETDILDSLGGCPFVCSVTTSGLAAEAGREKALAAARLAIAAIALLWATPSSVLEEMNLLFDRWIVRKKVLTFVPGKIVLAGSRLSHMPHGPWMKDGDWENEFARHRPHFRVVGEVLDYVIDPVGNASRPKMMNTLTQALLWFHEGCRETVTLMAIVKYSAVLDALASGGKSGGIRQLISARLGIQDNAPVWTNGPTLKQAVDEIYSDGRSRTIHGTNEKLGHDWSGTKGLAEQFSRLCLLRCIEWAATNASSDDPKQLKL